MASLQVCAVAVCVAAVIVVFGLIITAIIDARRGHHGSAALMLIIAVFLADLIFVLEWVYFIRK